MRPVAIEQISLNGTIMKGALLLTVVLVGLVSVHGHWERNKVYKYKVKGKGLKYSPDRESRSEAFGYGSFHLTLRPYSDDVIIGQLTDAEFARRYDEESQRYSGSDEGYFRSSGLSKPFKINLRNGVIQSLGVDRLLSYYELDQLKLIMSQFQVDTNAQNRNSYRYSSQSSSESGENYRRKPNRGSSEDERSSVYYKTVEPSGQCETTYDISLIPDYLVKSHPEWVPLPEIKQRNEDTIEIVKTKDSPNCEGRRNAIAAAYSYLREKGVRENDLSIVEKQRIVVSGSVRRFAIQSALTSVKLMYRPRNTPLVAVYLNATLESVESASQRFDSLPENLKIVDNLNYQFYPKEDDNRNQLVQPRQYRLNDVEYRWTTICYAGFMFGNASCHSEFGVDWSYTGKYVNCGFSAWRFQCKQGYELLREREKFKTIADEMDQTFAELAGY